jgi:hypothetical protein
VAADIHFEIHTVRGAEILDELQERTGELPYLESAAAEAEIAGRRANRYSTSGARTHWSCGRTHRGTSSTSKPARAGTTARS